MMEEGKEGDTVKKCRETTGPLFLLKELPHHSARMGGYKYLSIGRGLTAWPTSSKVVQHGPF